MDSEKNLISENHFYKKLLRENLHKIFGEFDEDILKEIEDHLEWLELEGGDVLIREGEQGDSLYFVLSGRMKASILDNSGIDTIIGEIVRGEIVGEMSIYTDEPRFATVTALRNCVLVKLTKEIFYQILENYPKVSLNITKQVIERLKKSRVDSQNKELVNICFIHLHDTIREWQIIDDIFNIMSKSGNYAKISVEDVEMHFGAFSSKNETVEHSKKIIHWLNKEESKFDKLFYFCDTKNEAWYSKCIKQADHIVVFADASQSHEVIEFEKQNLSSATSLVTYVLVHPNSIETPSNTRSWIDSRHWISKIVHIRADNKKDYHRLSRIVDEKAIGLVLAGGGAKGFAHLGILKALREYEIEYDFIGGTSIGAIMAFGNSFDRTLEDIIDSSRRGAYYNPFIDYNFFPLISILKGRRLRIMVKNVVKELAGRTDVDVSDAWKTLFIVATNSSTSEEVILSQGDLITAATASASIPGIFPPVLIQGNLYVDGCTFNNFPTDVMKKMGADKIIGVDFSIDKVRKLDITEIPGNMDLLMDKFFFWRKKKYKLPGLTSTIFNSMLLSSNAKRLLNKGLLDLHFNPEVHKYSITAMKKFDQIVEAGYLHAREVLESIPQEELNKFRNYST
jgi:NTE family protein